MSEPTQPLSDHPIHPWYGPCDALANGVCAECIKTVDRLREKYEAQSRYMERLEEKYAAITEAVCCTTQVRAVPEGGRVPDLDTYKVGRLFDMLERLRLALEKYGYRGHYYCEDGWYSCPKARDGCDDDSVGPDCNCGADDHNAAIDAILRGEEQA